MWATELPPALIKQLKMGGVIIIPIGFKEQVMTILLSKMRTHLKKLNTKTFDLCHY